MTDLNQQSGLSKEQIDSVIALYSAGQYQEAVNQIKILNQSYPNTPFLFNLIGACYKSLGQLEGSAKMLGFLRVGLCFAVLIILGRSLQKSLIAGRAS